MDRVSLAHLARRGLVVIALALAGIFVLEVVTAAVLLERFAPGQPRYARAAAAASLAHSGMLDEETGLRAFLATRDQTFLDPYTFGQKEIADGNLQLASLLGQDKKLQDDSAAVATAQQPIGLDSLDLGASLPGLAAKYGQAFRRQEPSDPPSGYRAELTRTALAVPMIVGARCIGVIELTSTVAGTDADPGLSVIETLAIHAGSALEAARLHRLSEEMAQVDALTRLLNRRRLDDDLAKEVARSVRYERPLAFVMLDTDHFKQLNDDLGHQRGDQVLQELAAILSDGLRASDTAYRYGGEEFALVMRESTATDAATGAERLRGRIEQRFGGPGNPANVTASFGVASLGPGVETAADLVRVADSALYQAKQTGRNRVVWHPPTLSAPRSGRWAEAGSPAFPGPPTIPP